MRTCERRSSGSCSSFCSCSVVRESFALKRVTPGGCAKHRIRVSHPATLKMNHAPALKYSGTGFCLNAVLTLDAEQRASRCGKDLTRKPSRYKQSGSTQQCKTPPDPRASRWGRRTQKVQTLNALTRCGCKMCGAPAERVTVIGHVNGAACAAGTRTASIAPPAPNG